MVVKATRRDRATGETTEEEITDYAVNIRTFMAAGTQQVTVTYVAAGEDGQAKAFKDSMMILVLETWSGSGSSGDDDDDDSSFDGGSGHRTTTINSNLIPLSGQAGGPVTAGTWNKDEKGWRFKTTTGNDVIGKWILAEWKDRKSVV